jgi:hypothetical protein
MSKVFPRTPASNDFGDVNTAWAAGFDHGWRSGARFMSRVTSRLRPKLTSLPDKANSRALHPANGTGTNSDAPMLPF